LSPLKEHPAHQKIIFFMFEGHFCPPGSGPDSEPGSGYLTRSRDPIDSGSNPDPDTPTLIGTLTTYIVTRTASSHRNSLSWHVHGSATLTMPLLIFSGPLHYSLQALSWSI
jgi:hypothetical protein